ncbi:helicase [Escherichia coli]|uniref:Helicase n=1 Tax=Escherichia coli TaxID=562 RepID=A0A376P864_ECOLX|nr:helicase [Escherichia coli]
MLQRCGANAALRDAEKTLNEALQKLRDAHTCEAAEDAPEGCAEHDGHTVDRKGRHFSRYILMMCFRMWLSVLNAGIRGWRNPGR